MSAVLVVLLPALPFLAAVLALSVGRAAPRLVAPTVITGTALAWLAALGLLAGDISSGGANVSVAGPVVPTGGPRLGIDLHLDGLAAVVSFMVTTVALAVQVYSTGYLRHDGHARPGPRYPSYAALVAVFTAAMLLVVVADDLFVLIVGWEVMGACSYLLIGHHWEEEGARAAAVKAFVMTRIGDVGLLFGVFALGVGAGSFGIRDVTAAVLSGRMAASTLTAGGLLLLLGVVGKSAQFPLHSWLPDAMAGPTPVSALIHAATMVAAGVYLVARMDEVFLASSTTLVALALVAAITMLGAALAALAQPDLKRVLAWSTVSQLAYMLAALAAGSYVAAGFHLLTHAAFKALLFLCAGAVAHTVGSTLLADMGGLRRRMPLTASVMAVGLLALAGVPPLSGGFSKEAVLGAVEEAALGHSPLPAWAGWVLLLSALATVAVTAAYTTRAWLLAFEGPEAASRAASHGVPVYPPTDPPASMAGPMLLLAVPAALLGLAGLSGSWLPSWLGRGGPGETGVFAAAVEHTLSFGWVTTVASLLLVAVGAGGTFLAWRSAGRTDPALHLGRARALLTEGFRVDEVYQVTVVAAVQALRAVPAWVDRDVIDVYVQGSARTATALGRVLRVSQLGQVQVYIGMALAGATLVGLAAVVAR